MSEVCIIGASNLKHISLISLYTRYFDENKIPYDLIYWDRYGIEEENTAEHVYRYRHDGKRGKADRILGFLGFRNYVLKNIKRNNYKIVITWQTTVGYLLFDCLLRRYKNRYVINVRDYVAENNGIAKPIIKRLVNNAGMVAISSEGFKEFLPPSNYITVNSINEDILSDGKVQRGGHSVPPYKIGFAGNCRYFRECYKLIDALANDERFELWYCGTNSDVLAEYAAQKNISNVFVKPSFEKKDTLNLFSEFDMVNSAFGNDAFDNRTLVPIRLYTALSLHIPVLANEGTQLAKEISSASTGYIIEGYEGLGDRLFSYLSSLDSDSFGTACDEYMVRARNQNTEFYSALKRLMEQ